MIPTTRSRAARAPWAAGSILALGAAATLVTAGPASAQIGDPAPPCTAAVPPAGFVDAGTVAPVHQPAVACLALYGVTRGVPTDGGFAFLPERSLSRGAMASLLARGIRTAGYELPPPADAFPDLEGSVHADAVRRLAAAGIVEGVTEDLYRPAENITRAQAAALLLRAAAYLRDVPVDTLYAAPSRFTDVGPDGLGPAVGGAAELGLVQGVTPTTFAPEQLLSRAQMASLVARLLSQEAVPTQTCTSPEYAYSVAYPADWQVNDGTVVPECSVFDPEPFTVPEGTELPTELAVSWSSEDAPFDVVVGGGIGADVVSETAFTVDGRPAVRQQLVATGEGLYDEGFRHTIVAVDRGGTTLVGQTFEAGELPYDLKQAVLTRMALSLDLSATGLPPFVPPGAVLSSPTDGTGLGLVDVRVGAQGGYERVVFEFQGTGEVGWVDVDYTLDPVFDPSGLPVDIDGEPVLTLGITGVGTPPQLPDVPPYDGPESIPGPGDAVVEVVIGSPFEGILDSYVGADGALPFRVFRLSDPERLVVDVATTPVAAG